MSKGNMFESYVPIRDVDYYYTTLKKFKENPDLMSGVKMINLHCRCVCPDLPEGLKGVACYNKNCHFGKFKSRLRSCNVTVTELQEEGLFNKILYTMGVKEK